MGRGYSSKHEQQRMSCVFETRMFQKVEAASAKALRQNHAQSGMNWESGRRCQGRKGDGRGGGGTPYSMGRRPL